MTTISRDRQIRAALLAGALALGVLFPAAAEDLFGTSGWKLTSYTRGGAIGEIDNHPTRKNEIWLSQGTLSVVDRNTLQEIRRVAYSSGDTTAAIRSLAWDRFGKAWLATNMGLLRYDETANSFERYPAAVGSRSFNARKVECDAANNRVIIATDLALTVLSLDKAGALAGLYSVLDIPNAHQVRIWGGEIWAINSRVWRFDGHQWLIYDDENSALEAIDSADACIDKHGNVWIGCVDIAGPTRKAFLAKFDRSSAYWSKIPLDAVVGGARVAQAVVDSDDVMWLEAGADIVKIDLRQAVPAPAKFPRAGYAWLNTAAGVCPFGLSPSGGLMIAGTGTFAEHVGHSAVRDPRPAARVIPSGVRESFALNGRQYPSGLSARHLHTYAAGLVVKGSAEGSAMMAGPRAGLGGER